MWEVWASREKSKSCGSNGRQQSNSRAAMLTIVLKGAILSEQCVLSCDGKSSREKNRCLERPFASFDSLVELLHSLPSYQASQDRALRLSRWAYSIFKIFGIESLAIASDCSVGKRTKANESHVRASQVRKRLSRLADGKGEAEAGARTRGHGVEGRREHKMCSNSALGTQQYRYVLDGKRQERITFCAPDLDLARLYPEHPIFCGTQPWPRLAKDAMIGMQARARKRYEAQKPVMRSRNLP